MFENIKKFPNFVLKYLQILTSIAKMVRTKKSNLFPPCSSFSKSMTCYILMIRIHNNMMLQNLSKLWQIVFPQGFPKNILQLNDLKSWKYVVAKSLQIMTILAKNVAILFYQVSFGYGIFKNVQYVIIE